MQNQPIALRQGSGRLASKLAQSKILEILEYENDVDNTRRSAYYSIPDPTRTTPLQVAYSIFANDCPTLVERKQFRRLFVENILTQHDLLEFEEAVDINDGNPNFIEEVPLDSHYWNISLLMSYPETVRVKVLNKYVETGILTVQASEYVPLAFRIQDHRYGLCNPKPRPSDGYLNSTTDSDATPLPYRNQRGKRRI